MRRSISVSPRLAQIGVNEAVLAGAGMRGCHGDIQTRLLKDVSVDHGGVQ